MKKLAMAALLALPLLAVSQNKASAWCGLKCCMQPCGWFKPCSPSGEPWCAPWHVQPKCWGPKCGPGCGPTGCCKGPGGCAPGPWANCGGGCCGACSIQAKLYPWYSYWPLEAHFQQPAPTGFPYWPLMNSNLGPAAPFPGVAPASYYPQGPAYWYGR